MSRNKHSGNPTAVLLFEAVAGLWFSPDYLRKGVKIRGWKPQVSTLLCPCRGGKIPFASQAKISRFKTDLSSLHDLMRSPALIQLLPNRGKHPLRHIQIPADLQLINLKRQVGWIPRLNI